MNVLIVSQYFPPEPFRVGDLALALRDNGHNVTVLTGFPNYPKGKLYDGYSIKFFQREDYHGVSVIRVPLYPDTSYSKLARGLNYLSYAFTASVLGPFLCGPVDRIIVFQLSPATVGIPGVVLKYTKKRAPIYFWIQDIWPDSLHDTGIVKSSGIIKLLYRLMTFLYRHSDRIIVPSQGFVSRVMRHGVPSDKITFLPNWAEDLYQVVPPDPEFTSQEGMSGYFNVVFAGNIGSAQGLEVLLSAADLLKASHPTIQFVILGSGAKLDDLVAQAKQRNLTNVQFKGRKPVETMPGYFATADVLFLHLRKNPVFAITIPTKLQSYLACGRPIIGALEGSGAEVLLEAKAGVVCEPENAEALAAAILELYSLSPEERDRMAKNARAYYDQNFARSLIMRRFETLLHVGADSK